MKKAKRLLAVLLAAVMLMSAACIPSYAYTDANNWHTPKTSNVDGYYLDYDQTAGYLLDLLDQLLGDLNVVIHGDDINDLIGVNLVVTDIYFGILNIDKYMEESGNANGSIIINSVDTLIQTLVGISRWLDENDAVGIVQTLQGWGLNIMGDLISTDKGLSLLIGKPSLSYKRTVNNDKLVLEHLIYVISSLHPMLSALLGGELDAGFLDGTLNDLLSDLLGPNASLDNIDGALKDLLYSLLINSDAEVMNGAEGTDWDDPSTPDVVEKMTTVDDMVQQLIDWALITGTDDTIQGGANSMLGSGTEGLLPGLANTPGGATIGELNGLQADRDGDGKIDEGVTYSMSFYQLVANVLDSLLGGMLTPMLTDLLIDLVGIEITEQYPNGDPAIKQDMMYNLIIGAVEDLLVANGAPDLDYEVYREQGIPVDDPVGQVTALVKWFLDDGGLDALIKIDYLGIHIQDNFMSLLNDLARLLPGLLSGLGVFDGGDLVYSSDELNAYYAYNESFEIVDGSDETAVDSLYIPFEAETELLYVDTYKENADGSRTPDIYCYYDVDPSKRSVVNTTDPTNEATYRNPKMIRQYYVIGNDQVYASLIKLLLDSIIPGCYFPEWADTIPSVLAYGLASLASPLVPQNNYFARLDAYHAEQTKEGDIYEGTVNVTPIPYTVEKTITINDPAGAYTKKVIVPQAALDIGCSYLAAYLNSILDLSDAEKLDTDTSLEKFAGEFLVWGFTNYLPMLTGQLNGDTLGQYYNDGINPGYLEEGVFMSEVNAYLEDVYSSYADRETIVKDDDNDPSFDAIYTLLDNTLFKLIPTSWLPDIHGSQQFVLDWLLGNLIEFDLQGILGLLTVNTDENAELNLPVVQVLIRVIDRVLALVTNDHPLLLSVSRTNILSSATYSPTSVKTLDALLSCNGSSDSLPQLVAQLLIRINQFKRPLLATLLPLILSSEYERPYDEEYLGRQEITFYKVADLENYVGSLTQHINATKIKTLASEENAEAAIDGKATSVRNDDGTYNVVLSNNYVYGTYPDNASATRDIEYLKDAYYVAVESETQFDAEGNPVITGYDIYRNETYLTSAMTVDTEIDTSVPYGQEKYVYSDFAYASFYPRSGRQDIASYGDEYQTFAPEDFSGREYYYVNADKAIEAGQDYASAYRSFAENDLVSAYGDWYMFSVETQLRTKDLWDANGDGFSVMPYDGDDEDTDPDDSDYVAPSTKNKVDENGNTIVDADGNPVTYEDDGNPADGEPSMPTSMYPFSATSSSTFSFYNDKTGETITTEPMNSFNASNYEQIALALEYASDPENNVPLDEHDTESVVRLALESLEFDITLNADNKYDGSLQWETLRADSAKWSTLETWLEDNDFTIKENVDKNGSGTGTYTIARPAFKLIDSSVSISTPDIDLSSTPALPDDAELSRIKGIRTLQEPGKTETDEAYVALHKAYKEYITTLYQNRESLYNTMDNISFRLEKAEAVRSVPMQNNGDLIILDWALDYARENYYMFDAGRNYDYTGEIVNTVPQVTKVYTSASFENLRKAYDYAKSLREKVVSNTVATNEITQSMITAAYQGILYAIRQLVEFTGFADWTQLDNYIAMATEILNDPNKDDPELGYASGLDALADVLADSQNLRADTTIDCESQSRVDTQAAALNNAIQNLVFNSIPSIIVTDKTGPVDVVSVENVNNRLVGHIFGLEEGTGITEDIIGDDGSLTIAGITFDSSIGSDYLVAPSGRGNGTGAYIRGRIRTLERFRYYAVVYGDLNGDTRIDGSDAAYIQYMIANGKNTESDMDHYMFVAADANHDNVVDASDITVIQNHYARKDINGDGKFDENDMIVQTEHRTENVA
ncbi:MAG: dockerin type I repeat-containing protein [Clostridia bacterium]|nr:dockerin type I repeat-containing protein [Clostridia bacterium]